jgi:peroxiredoxin Q/BCP
MHIGDRLTDFSLPNQDGVVVTLAQLLGKGPLVFFFYPKDDTPVCTAEACAFRDASGDFLAAGAVVFGVSSDDVASHKRFADKHGLKFPLLSDVGGRLREAWGIKRGFFGLAEGRVTVVVDAQGVLRHSHEAMLQANAHVEAALKVVRTLAATTPAVGGAAR